MDNKGITGWVIGTLVVIAAIVGIVWYQRSNDLDVVASRNGSLYVGVTDITTDIRNVSEIELQVEKVEVHMPGRGWVEIASDNQSFDLLRLKSMGHIVLYAKADVEAGTYDRVRITLGDAIVTQTDGNTFTATMPNRKMVINGNINVPSGGSTHVKLDFLADQSLHTTNNKQYVFSPVVEMESRSNVSVNVDDDRTLSTSGGAVDTTTRVGMDLDGMSRRDFSLNSAAGLRVENTLSGVRFILGNKTYANTNIDVETSVDADFQGNTGGNMNTGTNTGTTGTGTGTAGTNNTGTNGGSVTGGTTGTAGTSVGSGTGGITTGGVTGAVGGLVY